MLLDYQTAREQLLKHITETLIQDERFVAAWLTGSYGRGEADAVSDLDLNIIVKDEHATDLCSRPQMVQAGTIPTRLALISQFGQPTLIHENHYNAPGNGSFTFVLYSENAVMVDWILIPQAQAQRPPVTRLLFDKVGIQVLDEPTMSLTNLAEKSAFFWMMLAITAKYIVRQDAVKVQGLLDMLHHLVLDIEQTVDGQAPIYRRGSLMDLQPTDEHQRKMCYELMQRMLDLRVRIIMLGINIPPAPTETIGTLLTLR